MKRILVDMDGVLSDVYARLFELDKEENNNRKTIDEIIGQKEAEAFPDAIRWVRTPGFFRNLPVMEDSQKVLKLLNEKFEIIIVSMATEYPESLSEKQFWLNEHFPFISWRQVVYCGNKSLVAADIMIDDHFKNLDNFIGETLMFVQPHNINSTGHNHRKVSSWAEIEKYLLE